MNFFDIFFMDIMDVFNLYVKAIFLCSKTIDPCCEEESMPVLETTLSGAFVKSDVIISEKRFHYELCCVWIDILKTILALKIGDDEKCREIFGEYFFLLSECIERYKFIKNIDISKFDFSLNGNEGEIKIFEKKIETVQKFFRKIQFTHNITLMRIRPFMLFEELGENILSHLSNNEEKEFRKEVFLTDMSTKQEFLYAFLENFQDGNSMLQKIAEAKIDLEAVGCKEREIEKKIKRFYLA